MADVSRNELRKAIENAQDCRARFLQAVPVSEAFEGQMVWEGIVHVFELEHHPTAIRAYAWSSPIEGSDKRRIFAVLHVPPIQSAADAVRAAIVAEFRAGKTNPSPGGDAA